MKKIFNFFDLFKKKIEEKTPPPSPQREKSEFLQKKILKIYSSYSYLEDEEGKKLENVTTQSLRNKTLTGDMFQCNELIIKVHAPIKIQGGIGSELFAMCDGSYALAMEPGIRAHALVKGSSANAMVKGAIALAEAEGADAYAQAEESISYAMVKGAKAVAYASGSSAYGEAAESIIIGQGAFRCQLYANSPEVKAFNFSHDGNIEYKK